MGAEALSRLPKGFIFTAFVNFTVGAVLGGIMTIMPRSSYHLAPIHAILNPYGWLTILIYGMTFAVLALSLGVKLPRVWQGWVQLGFAEGGVLFLVLGATTKSLMLSRIGVVVLVLTPILFLYNILSGVRYTKRLAKQQLSSNAKISASASHPQGSVLQLFGRFDAYQRTDRVGQRGTDLALMLFIVAALWAVLRDWNGFPSVGLGQSPALDWLMFYGWIGGTTMSVALHLAPRFLHRVIKPAWWWNVIQVAWFAGVASGMIATWWGSLWGRVGCLFVGLALIGTAVPYIWMTLVPESSVIPVSGPRQDSERLTTRSRPLRGPGAFAWVMSWSFATLLGVGLIVMATPFTLAFIHLLFLGFITALVYAVGYTAFPLILHRKMPAFVLAYVQLSCALLGAVFLIGSFLSPQLGLPSSMIALMIGGTLATAGVLIFLASWGLGPRAVRGSDS